MAKRAQTEAANVSRDGFMQGHIGILHVTKGLRDMT
jgi:hypothetical protein